MKTFDGVLLLSDLDGTLFDDEKNISPATYDAIDWFVREGGRFSIATGRARMELKTCPYLPINAPFCVSDGALILDERQNIVYRAGMPTITKELISSALARFSELCCEIFTDDKIFLLQCNVEAQKHMNNIQYQDYVLLSSLEGQNTENWRKIHFTGALHLMEDVFNFLKPWKNKFCLAASQIAFWELTALNVNKGAAARKIANLCNIAPDKIFAIGDSENDKELLQTAYIGFAPHNATENIRKIAQVRVGNNTQNAVAEVIQYLAHEL